ncbi:unnamed protein product [Closterium sp. Yama58-4]|nr:unnamed protein product [Closterium sp. Yama58-4]
MALAGSSTGRGRGRRVWGEGLEEVGADEKSVGGGGLLGGEESGVGSEEREGGGGGLDGDDEQEAEEEEEEEGEEEYEEEDEEEEEEEDIEEGAGEVGEGREGDVQHNPRHGELGQRRRGYGGQDLCHQSRGGGGLGVGFSVESGGGREGGGERVREREKDVVRQVRRDMVRLEARLPWLGVRSGWRNRRSAWRRAVRDSCSALELVHRLDEFRSHLLLHHAALLSDHHWALRVAAASAAAASSAPATAAPAAPAASPAAPALSLPFLLPLLLLLLPLLLLLLPLPLPLSLLLQLLLRLSLPFAAAAAAAAATTASATAATAAAAAPAPAPGGVDNRDARFDATSAAAEDIKTAGADVAGWRAATCHGMLLELWTRLHDDVSKWLETRPKEAVGNVASAVAALARHTATSPAHATLPSLSSSRALPPTNPPVEALFPWVAHLKPLLPAPALTAAVAVAASEAAAAVKGDARKLEVLQSVTLQLILSHNPAELATIRAALERERRHASYGPHGVRGGRMGTADSAAGAEAGRAGVGRRSHHGSTSVQAQPRPLSTRTLRCSPYPAPAEPGSDDESAGSEDLGDSSLGSPGGSGELPRVLSLGGLGGLEGMEGMGFEGFDGAIDLEDMAELDDAAGLGFD